MGIPNSFPDEIIGLIPAAGQATRLAPLPCSKELYPIGFRSTDDGRDSRPKVVSHYLLEKMRRAGIAKAYFVIRPGKWDIPTYFGDGTSLLDMNLAYLMLGVPFGVPFTLDQAYPFVKKAKVAFGFPDIMFECDDAFTRLINRQSASHADITLGLVPAKHPSTDDTVDVDVNGEVRNLVVCPSESSLRFSWCIALWTPAFTEFLHTYVKDKNSMPPPESELSMGFAIKAGIDTGFLVDTVILSDTTPYVDIGTPKQLYESIKHSVQTRPIN
jgi:glucose-1-phosphate thymidylyltransferase